MLEGGAGGLVCEALGETSGGDGGLCRSGLDGCRCDVTSGKEGGAGEGDGSNHAGNGMVEVLIAVGRVGSVRYPSQAW